MVFARRSAEQPSSRSADSGPCTPRSPAGARLTRRGSMKSLRRALLAGAVSPWMSTGASDRARFSSCPKTLCIRGQTERIPSKERRPQSAEEAQAGASVSRSDLSYRGVPRKKDLRRCRAGTGGMARPHRPCAAVPIRAGSNTLSSTGPGLSTARCRERSSVRDQLRPSMGEPERGNTRPDQGQEAPVVAPGQGMACSLVPCCSQSEQQQTAE